MRSSEVTLQVCSFGALCVAAIAVFASVIWAGAKNAPQAIRHSMVEGLREEELRSELVPAVAAIKARTKGATVAYVHDPSDSTGRSLRELAFPSILLFTSEAAVGADCMRELRARYPIRYLISPKRLDVPCLARPTRIATSTPKTPELWLAEIR